MQTLPTIYEVIGLTEAEIADSSLAGFHLRIERLESLTNAAHVLLTFERRACLLSHAIRGTSHAN